MNLPHRQRGFMDWVVYLVVVLVLLALAARFAWWAVTEENFGLVAAIIWAFGFGIAYFISLGDVFVVRMPAGFVVFASLGTATLPLSWLAESRIGLVMLLAAQLAFSFRAGQALSRYLRLAAMPRYAAGNEPAWLRQQGDLVADFGQWALLSLGALLCLLIAPLLLLLVASLAIDLSVQQVKWLVALWGLAGTAWLGLRARSAVRWRGIPACAWIYLLVTAGMLAADRIAGPFAGGTGVQAAYIAMPGALVAAFVEVFVFGGGPRNKPGDR